jgi:anaerobic magnesium-protoporphyrin IX monomethyl ester cyclase
MIKVTLISPNSPGWDFGVRTLAAVLKKEGYDARILFIPLLPGQRSVDSENLEQIADLSAGSDLIGMSVMTNFFSGMRVITQTLRDKLDIPIIWGGIHPTIRPDECLNYADMVCLGEGEIPLLNLARAMDKKADPGNIPGLGYKVNGKVVINEQNPLITELDRLPLPDYACENDYLLKNGSVRKIDKNLLEDILTSHTHTSKESYRIYHTITSRGCNFACAYCCNSYLNKTRHGQKIIRKRSVGNIIDEFTAVKRELPFVNCVLINDDDFFCRGADEIALFAKEYKEKIRLPLWITGLNVLEFDNGKFASLVGAGLRFIRLGIQSANSRTLKLYNRHYSKGQVAEAAKGINKFRDKIAAPSYDIILDNPWEAEDDLTETLMLISNLPKPYSIQLFSLTFYPGTELYNKAKQEGLIKDDIEEVYDRSFYAVKPAYLNKLFQLLAAYARQGLFIPAVIMGILTNPVLRRLKISLILYYALEIFIYCVGALIYYFKHPWEFFPAVSRKFIKSFSLNPVG